MKQKLFVLGALGILLVLLSEAYQVVGSVVSSPIVAALLLNSLLAACFLVYNRPPIPSLFNFCSEFVESRWIYFGIGIYFLCLCLVPMFSSAFGSIPDRVFETPHFFVTIILVPIVEEVVFRLAIGGWIRAMWEGLGGYYLSALFFGTIHATPTIGRIVEGQVGVVLGPFLLALICEWLYYKTKSLLAPILFHGMCNGSVLIFMYTDPRWLDWLSFLYI